MLQPPAPSDIQAARCTIHDKDAFLRVLRGVAVEYDTHIICFNADVIAGRVHAAAAVALAVRAIREACAISNTLEMESLLFAAGSRQCNIARSFGLHKGENRLYICCVPAARTGIWTALEPLFRFTSENWDVIDPEKKKGLMKTFSISSEELAAAGGDSRIIDLVLERVALLQVMR
jgi:KEOPS complex subunit Cgi121